MDSSRLRYERRLSDDFLQYFSILIKLFNGIETVTSDISTTKLDYETFIRQMSRDDWETLKSFRFGSESDPFYQLSNNLIESIERSLKSITSFTGTNFLHMTVYIIINILIFHFYQNMYRYAREDIF